MHPEIARLSMAATVTEPAWWIEAYAWVETRKRLLLYGLVVLLGLGLGLSYYLYRRGQREVSAARALSEAAAPVLTGRQDTPRASAYLAVADRFAGTRAGGYALLMGASTLLQEGDAAGAQARFERFLREYRAGPLVNQALFGLATALEIQGRTNEARERYESLAERRLENDPTIFLARLRLGRLAEARGEWDRARRYYEEVARALPMSAIGGEARLALQSLLEAHPELGAEAEERQLSLQPGDSPPVLTLPTEPAPTP